MNVLQSTTKFRITCLVISSVFVIVDRSRTVASSSLISVLNFNNRPDDNTTNKKLNTLSK